MEARLVDSPRSSDRVHVLARPFYALLTPTRSVPKGYFAIDPFLIHLLYGDIPPYPLSLFSFPEKQGLITLHWRSASSET
jgi:hypothetical protein